MRVRPRPRVASRLALPLAIAALVGPPGRTEPLASLVPLRLQAPLSSAAHDGDAVRAISITSPLAAGAGVPAGCTIRGVARLDQGLGRTLDRTALRVSFTEVVDRDGTVHVVRGSIATIDNARESMSGDGAIIGLEPLRAMPSRLETVLLLVAHAHPLLMATAAGVRLADREVDRPGIHLAAGTEVAAALTRSDQAPLACAPVVPVVTASADVREALDGTAVRSTTDDGQVEADWVNLAVVGAEPAIREAFASAGWTTAAQTSVRADTRTFLALATHHGYREGPVSGLRLDGARPAMVYQKQNNTFAKRHHIRLWSTSRRIGGRAVWLAAATHDIGVEFSSVKRHFTHRIDGAIDDERAKVAGDLALTGAVDGVMLLERAAIPAESRNAAGDAVVTDGRLAIVTFRTSGAPAQ